MERFSSAEANELYNQTLKKLESYELKSNELLQPQEEEYITLLLKLVSIYNAEIFQYYSRGAAIPTALIDGQSDHLIRVFSYQQSKEVHTANNLTISEVVENFQHWIDFPRATLLSFVIKEAFLTDCLIKCFINDKRWSMLLGDISYKLARSALCMVDLKRFQKNNLISDKELPAITKLLSLVISIHESSADECLKTYAINRKNYYWCFRAINLLYTAGWLYQMKQENEKQALLLDRIDRIRHQLDLEQSKEDSSGLSKKNIADMPIDELLRLDKHFFR